MKSHEGRPVNPTLGFVSPKWVARASASKASRGARHLLLLVASHANERGVAWPSVASLAARLGTKERQVQRYLAELEALGELGRDHRGGRGKLTVYTILVGGSTEGALPESTVVERVSPMTERVSSVTQKGVVGDTRNRQGGEQEETGGAHAPAAPHVERVSQTKARSKPARRVRGKAPAKPLADGLVLAHPAVAAYVEAFKDNGTIPTAAQADAIMESVGSDDRALGVWRKVLRDWRLGRTKSGRAYNPGSVPAMLDRFAGDLAKAPGARRVASTSTPTPAPRVPTDDADAPRDEALYPPGIAPALWHGACAVAALIEARLVQLDGVGSQRWALAAVAWIRATDPDAEPKRHAQALGELHAAATANDAAALAVLDAIALGTAGKAVACVA